MTDLSTKQHYEAPSYWERFRMRLPWAVALCAAIGLVHGLTAGRSGLAVFTYTLSAMATQAFIAAPLVTLILAALPSRRPVADSEPRNLG